MALAIVGMETLAGAETAMVSIGGSVLVALPIKRLVVGDEPRAAGRGLLLGLTFHPRARALAVAGLMMGGVLWRH